VSSVEQYSLVNGRDSQGRQSQTSLTSVLEALIWYEYLHTDILLRTVKLCVTKHYQNLLGPVEIKVRQDNAEEFPETQKKLFCVWNINLSFIILTRATDKVRIGVITQLS